MKIWGDVYNLDGSKRDEGPLFEILSAQIERVLDAPGSVRITVPLTSERVIDTIATERRVKLYVEHPENTKRYLGTGLIRKPQKNIDSLTFELNGPDQLDELRQKNVLVNRVYNGVPLTTALAELVGLVRSTTDLCTSGTPSASTSAVGHAAAAAFDNDSATYWESTALPATLTFTFGAAKAVRRMTIVASTNGPVNFALEGDDGGMTVVSTVVNEDGWNGEKRTYDFADPGFTSTAWQLNISSAAGAVVRIYEVEMMVQSDWTLDTTGVTGDLYAEFDGVSVLGALQDIAKQTGYHFVLSDDHEITFGPLGDAAPIRLYQPHSIVSRAVYNNDDIALVDPPRIVDDSENTVNWVLPLGRGDDRVSLEFVQPGDLGSTVTDHDETHYTTPGSIHQLYNIAQYTHLAQSFQVAADTKVIAVSLFLSKFMTGGTPVNGTLSVSLFTDSGSSPGVGFSGTPAHYHEADLPDSPYADIDFVTFWFENPVSISASTTYWIVLTTDRATTADYVVWGMDDVPGSYASGISKRKAAGAWSISLGKDFIFKVWGVATTESPYLPRHMTGPDGAELWYLADDTSIALYGQIEQVLSTEVGAQGAAETDLQNAAQLLYLATSTYLERHVSPQSAYQVRLHKCYATLRPGMLIPFKYVGAVETSAGETALKYVDINGTFWITRVNEDLNPNDTTVDLELSNVPRPLSNVLDTIAGVTEQVNIEAVRRDYLPLIRDVVAVTPATPPSGKRKLYPRSDGWYDLDDAGVELGPLSDLGLIPVTNSSGAEVTSGMPGYIDENGAFRTTTTDAYIGNWCVAVIGGANAATIRVARAGRVTIILNANCAIGDWLKLSATAGQAGVLGYVAPEVFARALTANTGGAGGTCEALLYCNSVYVPMSLDINLFSRTGISDTDFVATQNGAVSGATLVYNAPSSGDEMILSLAVAEAGLVVLHNTTRGESAVISACNVATNTITVTDAADIAAWTNGNTLTIQSQTNTDAGYMDIELTSDIPALAYSFQFSVQNISDSGGANAFAITHPYSAGVTSQRRTIARTVSTGIHVSPLTAVDIRNRRFCLNFNATGTGTLTLVLRASGVMVKAP